MKTNNIIIGTLVAVVVVMGVAFAAFSTSLNVNGTANISSTWNVAFKAGTCTPTVQKDSGLASTGTVTVSGTTATVSVDMASPGDVLTCTIIAENKGTLPAIRTAWAFTSGEDAEAGIFLVTASAPTATTLEPGTGTETLTLTITFPNDTGQLQNGGTFTAFAIYTQDLS